VVVPDKSDHFDLSLHGGGWVILRIL